MKILMLNQADIGGGAEKIALSLSKKLNERDIICDLYVDEKKSNNKFVYSINRNNIEKIFSKIINKGLTQQSKYCGNISTIKNNLKKYDLVHIHNLHGNYINLDIINHINSRNIPIVWTMHDFWPCTGRCCADYDCGKWINGCGKCGERLSSYPRMIRDNSSKVLQYKKSIIENKNITFISPSVFLSELFKTSYLKNENIEVINNGIDLTKFKTNNKEILRKKYNLKNDKKYILLLAAKLNNKYKGMSIALDIINGLKNKKNIGVITVGNGIDSELIKDIDIVNLGYIKDDIKLNEIYSISDIFLNCTLADNFSTTNIEAMASGTPIIATKLGGNIEQINDECGWLFNKGDIKAATKLLDEVLKGSKEIDAKSLKCRQRAVELYGIESMVEKYIDLYKRILS